MWLGKIGDLLDLKADAEALTALEDTLSATTASIESKLVVAKSGADGGQEQLVERLSALEDTVAAAPNSSQVRPLSVPP